MYTYLIENYIEIIGFTAAGIGTLSLSPQVIKVFKSKNVNGISSISYGMICIDSILWLIYGWAYSAPPLILQSLFTFLCSTIVLSKVLLNKEAKKTNSKN